MSDNQTKEIATLTPAPPEVYSEIAVRATGIEALLMRAIETGNLDAIERVMGMRRELKAEAAREQFFAALAEFQNACPIIRRTREVHNSQARGGGVRYRYAPLDVIVKTVTPLLTANGLSYNIQAHVDGQNDDAIFLVAVCNVYHAAGHTESSEFRVPIASGDFMNDAQRFAAAAMYARRYAFINALGIVTGDESGGVTVTKARAAKARPAATPEQPGREADATPVVGDGWSIPPQQKLSIINLWNRALELGIAERELREFLGSYGCISRKEITPEQASNFVSELSKLINERLEASRKTY